MQAAPAPHGSRAGDRFLDPRPFPAAPPPFVVRGALALYRRLLRLAEAVLPPEVIMLERCNGAVHAAALGACARLGISDLLAERGPSTAEQIAAALGTHADTTHRVLRALAARDVFTLDARGRFANNRLSSTLRSGTPLRTREWALYATSASNLDAQRALEHAVRTGEPCFPHANGVGVWDWFERHPEEREHFAHAMMGLTFVDAPLLASMYPFAEIQRICDVGGGRGSLLSELLVRHLHLRAVLCDAAGVLESARSLLAARGVADRVELVPTNFFERVPPGADAYLMKNILHDWDDARCLRILGNVRQVIPSNGRLLIVELLCEPNETTSIAPMADLQMLVACDGGRERSRADFERLLGASGFRLRRVFPSATMNVIEGEPV